MTLCLTSLAVLPATGAQASDGGAAAPTPPTIKSAKCPTGNWSCAPTETLTLRGKSLKSVKAVIFLGENGKADDRKIKPFLRKNKLLKVSVPADAASGPLLVTSKRSESKLRTKELQIQQDLAISRPEAVFPINGSYEIGESASQRFGGSRNHQGQDVFAKCGTPLVAAQAGEVYFVGYHARAGNYLVVQLPDGGSHAYMHLKDPSLVEKGSTVYVGQPVGEVGDTGRAEGCHLHFEIWTAPGWYQGGKPIDPYDTMKSWEK